MPARRDNEKSACIFKVFLVCLILSLCSYVILQLGRFDAPPSASKARRRNKNEKCGFNGDADIYGVGIRIGYYTQAVSVWFANYFVARLSSTLRSVNSLFMFALLVGLLWFSRVPSNMFAIEAWLLNQLLTATWFVGVIDVSRFSRKYQRFDPVRSIIHTTTIFALGGYMTWYYWFGLDRMKRTPCGTYVLLIVVKVDLYGWFRTLAKASTLVAVYQGTKVFARVSIKITHHFSTRHLRSPAFTQKLSAELIIEEVAGESNLIPGPTQLLLANPCILPQVKTSKLGMGDKRESQGPQADAGESHSQEADSIFETAKRTPLPPSPSVDNQQPLPPSPLINNIIPESSASSRVPSLSSLLAADAYIDSVLNGFEQGKLFSTHRIPHTPIRIVWPKIQWLTPAYISNFATHLFRCHHRPGIFAPIFIHLYESRTYAHNLFPDIFNTAVDHPGYQTISTDALNVVLVFRMLRQPHSHPRQWYMYQAVMSLGTCLFAAVSIELGIAWNWIGGLGDVGKVGQLVPAVLGVGGLVKVGWTKWKDRGADTDEKANMETEWVDEEMKRCGEVYDRLRKARAPRVQEENPPDRVGTIEG
ncbi:MAG: hypothetical protein Q9202_002745 [Teloschistes flavicans]